MPSVVQSNSASNSNVESLNVTLSGCVSGNLIVVCGLNNFGYAIVAGDSQSNNYRLDATGSGWSQLGFNIWSATAQSGNAIVTISGAAGARMFLVAREISSAFSGVVNVVGSGSQSSSTSGNTQSITPTSASFIYAAHCISNVSGNFQYASGWTSGVGLTVSPNGLIDEYNVNWPGDATKCPASTQFQDGIWDNLAVAYSSGAGPTGGIAIFFESGPKRQYRRNH